MIYILECRNLVIAPCNDVGALARYIAQILIPQYLQAIWLHASDVRAPHLLREGYTASFCAHCVLLRGETDTYLHSHF